MLLTCNLQNQESDLACMQPHSCLFFSVFIHLQRCVKIQRNLIFMLIVAQLIVLVLYYKIAKLQL